MKVALPSELPYLDAFPAPSEAAWRAAVDKVLKGADFEKRLTGRTADGIRIAPLYPAATPRERVLRGKTGRWHVAARLDHPDPDAARALALADLEGGGDTLTISFAGARAARGYGLVAEDVAVLDAALDGVMLDLIRVRLDPAPQGLGNTLLLAALVKQRGLNPADVAVEFGLDPIGVLASHGWLGASWSGFGLRLAETIGVLKVRGYKGPFVAADTRPYHEAGASEAHELGVALATAVEYLRALEAQGMALDEARDAIAFTLVADTDEFVTVAKFRAARLLWNKVQQACGLAPMPAIIHAETAWRALTKRDPWVNLLRGTVAAFSAGVGGADSLTVQPFTAALGLADSFARRVARNTQLILLEESNLWRVADPAAGAGGFEALTQALCEQGWQAFQQIEQQGGILAALTSGHLQKKFAEQRAARTKAITMRRQPITGTSEFPSIREGDVAVLDVAPMALASSLGNGAAWQVEPLPSFRLAEPFENLRDKADALPKRPVVFLATLGSIADFTARAGFARNLFEAGGFSAPSGDGFARDGATDLEALTGAFRASGANLACLCGTDVAYANEGAAAAKALVDAGGQVWIAGRPEDAQSLKKAGVTWSISVGCDAVEALEWAQAFIRVESQP